MDLRVRQGNLECPSTGEANDDLIPDPLPGRSAAIHGVKQSAADRAQATPNYPKQRYDPNLGQGDSLYDGGDCQGNDKGEHFHTRPDRTAVIDTLEIDGEEVKDSEVCAAEEEHEDGADHNVALGELLGSLDSIHRETDWGMGV